MIKRFFPPRVWILLLVLFFALLAINPRPGASGIEITTVKPGSIEAAQGMGAGEVIKTINDHPIRTLQDYAKAIKEFEVTPIEVAVETDKGLFTYNTTRALGFQTDKNLTIIAAERTTGLEYGMTVLALNAMPVETLEDLAEVSQELLPTKRFTIETTTRRYEYLIAGLPEISVGQARTSNIQKGLELEGGTRVLLQPKTDTPLQPNEVDDIIKVLTNRLNVYGLADLKIRPAGSIEGKQLILIELAGVTAEDVRDLIAQQGKFEAKIGGETVFVGGKDDIPFVCRNDGSCSGVRDCVPSGDGWFCRFEFVIHLSGEAAQRHAKVTDKYAVVPGQGGSGGGYLNQTIDFYLDGQLVDSLQVAASLKGVEATAIAITGSGAGGTRNAAVEDATAGMDRLQTILITGSLPVEMEIVKLDTISPVLGQSFIRNALLTGLGAVLAVAAVMFFRYRRWKIVLPMTIATLSEIFIILGVSALIRWELDLSAIAGIVASVGTGVDALIIIADETMRGEINRFLGWKEKVKRAFMIIMTSYATTVVAMLPLWYAGAGLIRGFAVTTIIGVSIGVFITRPAFAAILEKILEERQG